MSFLVAYNVVANRPPECRPTGMLHTCAKTLIMFTLGSDETDKEHN